MGFLVRLKVAAVLDQAANDRRFCISPYSCPVSTRSILRPAALSRFPARVDLVAIDDTFRRITFPDQLSARNVLIGLLPSSYSE
jgi:hypothetical protein